jgi:dipeptidyl aminopeptidase/acylaminoacyl peptidase
VLVTVAANGEGKEMLSRQSIQQAIALLLLPAAGLTAQTNRTPHDVSVRDSVEMTRFINPSDLPGSSLPAENFAPDSHQFFVITQHGAIETNELEATVWLFDTSAVERALLNKTTVVPRALVRLKGVTVESDINDSASVIRQALWLPDGKHLMFLGRNRGFEWHLYEVTIGTGSLRQLTPNGQDVQLYSVANNSLVYLVMEPKAATRFPRKVVVTGRSIQSLLFPDEYTDRNLQIWTMFKGRQIPVRTKAGAIFTFCDNTQFPNNEVLSLSPDGHYLVGTTEANPTPSSWAAYVSPVPQITIPADDLPGPEFLRLRQYFIVDMRGGDIVKIDAPLGSSLFFDNAYSNYSGAGAVWTADSKHVFLVNTLVPLNHANDEERKQWISQSHIIAYDPAVRRWTVVAPVKESHHGVQDAWALSMVRPGAKANELTLHYSGSDHPDEVYRKEGESWTYVGLKMDLSASVRVSRHVAPDPEMRLSIFLHQALNSPPTLFASFKNSQQSEEIWDPNPQLRNVDLGEARIYNWLDGRGDKVKGVLFLPLHYVQGIRYPLVIEPRAYFQDRFIMDGAYSTAVAARAMAAAGIVVLEAGEPEFPNHDEDWEKRNLSYALDGYTSAVQSLDKEGIVDPEAVGIIGFSRTCAYALYSITMKPAAFKAATIANGDVNGYLQFMIYQDLYGLRGLQGPNYIDHYGGPPYGRFLTNYLQENPAFNLDKVKAAVRVETHGRGSLLYDWETYIGLRTLNKPVDMIMLPYASHVVSTPDDVLESQQGDVDWFRFWLQGFEDDDPAKAEQYRRWERLRTLKSAEDKFAESPQPEVVTSK